MRLLRGNRYCITLENGQKIKGILDELNYFGGKIYALWLRIGAQPVYILFNDIKKIDNLQ